MSEIVKRGRIALLFNRSYIDTQQCYMELPIQLANNGFQVDLYMLNKTNNYQPFFENQDIRILPFPDSAFQKTEYWSKIVYAKDRRYKAIIGTPVQGVWIAYKTANIQRVPFYYFADELADHLLHETGGDRKKKLIRQNFLANKKAAASIALGLERYELQRSQNKIDYPHDTIILPNAQTGSPVKLKSNFFRDIFNIEDRRPILLFAGTLNWLLAKKIYEETKSYGERDYHLIFHARTLGLMGENNHPFIKISSTPIPANMLNYAVSSADIGLALYDKHSPIETNNALTAGKIGTYLKNMLPLISGSAESLRLFQREQVGVYWDGEQPFDEIALEAIRLKDHCQTYIPEFYKKNLQYELFFENFLEHLLRAIN